MIQDNCLFKPLTLDLGMIGVNNEAQERMTLTVRWEEVETTGFEQCCIVKRFIPSNGPSLPGLPRTVCTVRLSILPRKTQIARVSFAGFFYVYVCGMHLPMFTYRWEWAPVCVSVCMPLCVCVCCESHRLMAGFFLISSTLYLLRRSLSLNYLARLLRELLVSISEGVDLQGRPL